MPLDAVFFDLDYTLYDQSQYVRGALADVADSIAREALTDGPTLERSLLLTWHSVGSRYDRLFDLWLARHGLWSRDRVDRCVAVFHEHRPQTLRLYPGAQEMLDDLKAAYQLGIITDGHAGMQRIKIDALGLADQVQTIVYSAALSRWKPDPEVFHHALHEAGVPPRGAAFVGDHPLCDIVGARQVGMRAIRLMLGEFKSLPDDPRWPPHDRVRSLGEIPIVLASAPGTVDAACPRESMAAALLPTTDGVS